MVSRLKISDSLELSRLSLGFWRLLEWNFTEKELLNFIEELFEIGVTPLAGGRIFTERSEKTVRIRYVLG